MDELFANEDYTAIYEAAIQTIHRPQYASCEIVTIGNYDKKQVVWALQKNSEYLSLFNHYLLTMVEKGITEQILENYEHTPPTCPDLSGAPFTLKDCFTGFIPIIAGIILAIIMLVIEIIADKSFGVDISKFYENVPADDANAGEKCHKCGIDLHSNH